MKSKNLLAKLSLIGLIAYVMLPMTASAASQLSPRKATLSTSQAGAAANVVFSFTTVGSYTVKGIKFEMCNSPVQTVACAQSNGSDFSTASATLGGQTGISGFAESNKTTTEYDITNAGGTALGSPTAVTVTINGLTLPSAANTEFYFRITTYTDTGLSLPAATGQDYGGIAVSTAQQITVSGTMPESLVFCVGTSGTDCTNMTGSAVNLGTFSPTGTNTGTSLMDASTNASSGYVITVNGATMTSGANTIAAMGTQSANSAACSPSCTSTTGTSQFGSNTVANTTPSVGANVSGGGTGAAFGGYGSANSFRFFSGDTVASVAGPTNSNLFTNSYIVNVPGSQAAGLYTSTLTYICTATF